MAPDIGRRLLAEVVGSAVLTLFGAGTYILVLAIMAMAIDPRANPAWSGWVIGLAVAAAVLLVGPVIGGILAALSYDWIARPPTEQPEGEEQGEPPGRTPPPEAPDEG